MSPISSPPHAASQVAHDTHHAPSPFYDAMGSQTMNTADLPAGGSGKSQLTMCPRHHRGTSSQIAPRSLFPPPLPSLTYFRPHRNRRCGGRCRHECRHRPPHFPPSRLPHAKCPPRVRIAPLVPLLHSSKTANRQEPDARPLARAVSDLPYAWRGLCPFPSCVC